MDQQYRKILVIIFLLEFTGPTPHAAPHTMEILWMISVFRAQFQVGKSASNVEKCILVTLKN